MSAADKLIVAYAACLVTIADVMMHQGVTADEAWSMEYADQHAKYLRVSGVHPELIQELTALKWDELKQRC